MKPVTGPTAKEQALRKQLADKNKAAQQLNSKIQAIIEEEIYARPKRKLKERG